MILSVVIFHTFELCAVLVMDNAYIYIIKLTLMDGWFVYSSKPREQKLIILKAVTWKFSSKKSCSKNIAKLTRKRLCQSACPLKNRLWLGFFLVNSYKCLEKLFYTTPAKS